MAQPPALGDTIRFTPAAFLGELSARLEDTPRQIVREVTGRVVYINHRHRHYGVVYEVDEYRLMESFKF